MLFNKFRTKNGQQRHDQVSGEKNRAHLEADSHRDRVSESDSFFGSVDWIKKPEAKPPGQKLGHYSVRTVIFLTSACGAFRSVSLRTPFLTEASICSRSTSSEMVKARS